MIIYTTLKLFNDGKQFKLPGYLLDKVIYDNLDLLVKHDDVNISYYTPDNIRFFINTAERKVYEGSFEGNPVTWNLLVMDIKPIQKD